MATATRPLPRVITDFVAEIARVVATTDDRRDTIGRLYPSFAALTDRKNKASFLPPRRRRVAPAPRSTTAGRAP
jgi:hypothetical protein